jgi:hypothetical protein
MATRRSKDEDEIPFSGFTLDDLGSGRWEGGRCTVTDPRFEYRTQKKRDGGEFTVIEFKGKLVDQQETPHDERWQAASADFAMIRAEAKPGAEEAERGYALSPRKTDQREPFRVRGDEEFGMFLQSLFTNGYPESNLMAPADIRVVDGLEVEVIRKKRTPDDKYPPLVVTEIYSKLGKASASAKGKGRNDDADADTEAPRAARGKTSTSKSADPETIAVKLIRAVAKENGGEVTTGDLVRETRDDLKNDYADQRKDILDYFGDDKWLSSQDDWTYDKKTRTVTLA